MTHSIAALWTMRSQREQVLLLTAGALFVALVAWYGVATPFRSAAADAETHRIRAAQQWADVESAVNEIRAANGGAALPEGGIEDAVMASAEVSGVALERNRVESPREITVWAKGVDHAALFTWIKLLQKAHGVVPANLTATRDEDGALDVELRLAGAAR